MDCVSGFLCHVTLSEMPPHRPGPLRLLFAVANNVPHNILIKSFARAPQVLCVGASCRQRRCMPCCRPVLGYHHQQKNAKSAGMRFMFHHVRHAVCLPKSLAPFCTPPVRNPRIGKSPQKRPTYLRLYCRRKSVQPKQIYCNGILIGPLERGPGGFPLPKRRRHQRGTGTLLLVNQGDQAMASTAKHRERKRKGVL